MKVKTLILTLLISLIFSISASAAEITLESHSLAINIGEEYTVLTPDNLRKNSEFIEQLGFSQTSIKAMFEKDSVILFAANENNTKQIKITNKQTDFSRQIGTLCSLKDEDIYSISEKILGEGVKWQQVDVNNLKFYRIASKGVDSGGDFCTVQYFTIVNGGIYNVVYSHSGTDEQLALSLSEELIKTFNITDTEQNLKLEDVDNVFVMSIIGVMGIASAAVIVYIIVTFVKDIKNKSEDNADASVIKRRRF